MEILAFAQSDHPTIAASARSLVAKLIAFGREHRKRPPDAVFRARFGPEVAAFVRDAWEVVRAFAASYERYERGARDPLEEEEFWKELGLLLVLTKPGTNESTSLAEAVVRPRARKFRTASDETGEVAAKETVGRMYERASRRRTYEPKGNPENAIAYVRKTANGILLDAASSSAEGVPASTERRWRSEYRRALDGKLVLPEELLALYGAYFDLADQMRVGRASRPLAERGEPADDDACDDEPESAFVDARINQRVQLAHRIRAFKEARMKQLPADELRMTLSQLAEVLGEPKVRVRDAFRAVRKRHPDAGSRRNGTWLLDAAAIRLLYQQLGKDPPG